MGLPSLPPPGQGSSWSNLARANVRPRTMLLSYFIIAACSLVLLVHYHAANTINAALTTQVAPLMPRANATFVTLARNSDLYDVLDSIQAVEDRFNHRYHYDWIFLNDKPFSLEFIRASSALVSGRARYGLIPKEHWSFPDWIDLEKAAKTREQMREKKVIYGDSIPYRHMCRFESGFFQHQDLMREYRYYWRVEPNIKLHCHIDYDLFAFMETNQKKYGFTLSLKEYKETIPTLWATVKKWMQTNAGDLSTNNMMGFLSDDNGESYNLCHFWSNFEIGDLDWLRSEAYTRFFNFLDKEGGFFYERWGDAPVHSIAASLLLNKSDVHFFDDVGYYHAPFTHCPNNEATRLTGRCTCDPSSSFDWEGYSCLSNFYDANNMQIPAKPKGR